MIGINDGLSRGIQGLAWLSLWNLSLLTGCDRAPREPESVSSAAPQQANELPPKVDQKKNSAGGGSLANDTCVKELAEPPPPQASSATECPEDPQGRPTMPMISVSFPNSSNAPSVLAEHARTTVHRTHGLMYRPKLNDEEGMLFSWSDERPRSFWMRNTCLALDMLFIAADGTITGILEQVPPMNEVSRSIPCPAAHVLELRAGWTREYGILPGQKLLINAEAE